MQKNPIKKPNTYLKTKQYSFYKKQSLSGYSNMPYFL